MKTMPGVLSAVALGIANLSCTDQGPKGACPTTSSVEATVTVGSSVVFNWEPKCAVALLLVEQNGGDEWGIADPNLSNSSTEAANKILPPVTYGQVPSGVDEDPPAAALVPGQSYTLVLWKVVPAGSTVQCQQNSENACLLAVKPFQR